ncbi:MAG: RluA family pseudouridine synthase [Candidatus Hydrogenedentes bacterium]|nr:RluA family pseudouridine synthase [Candidatus Hydrogenedentota bacterium]
MKSARMLVVEQRVAMLAYLQRQYPDTKRTALKQLLRHRAVYVNGNPITRHDHVLEPRDRVVIERGAPAPAHKAPAVAKPDIVFEDRHIIVINKPEGLLTIATDKEAFRTAYRQTMAYVQEDRPHRGERIFIVHRIDRDTSGLLVFARTEDAKRTMQANWENAEKKYFAVVEGVPREAEGTIRSHLREHPKSLRMHSAPPSDDAKLAITRYRVLRSSRHFALLEVKLETGRKNQIRAHLSEQGNPIAGDKKYDAHSNPIKRLALHAYYLSFPHPATGKRLVFKTDPPEEFERLLVDDVRATRPGPAQRGPRASLPRAKTQGHKSPPARHRKSGQSPQTRGAARHRPRG